VTMICFAYDIPFLECIHVYCCIISPQLLLVSRASDVVIVGVGAGAGVGVGIDIDIGIHAVRE
jgi:hypothetical protein